MTGAEWWGSVRQAVSEIRIARARLAALREPRGGTGEQGSTTTIGDPTGRIAIAIADSEHKLDATIRDYEGTISDGLCACTRVSAMMGQLAAAVMEGYYIDCLTWQQVADRNHVSQRSVLDIRKRAIELTDTVGIVHMVHGWDYEI